MDFFSQRMRSPIHQPSQDHRYCPVTFDTRTATGMARSPTPGRGYVGKSPMPSSRPHSIFTPTGRIRLRHPVAIGLGRTVALTGVYSTGDGQYRLHRDVLSWWKYTPFVPKLLNRRARRQSSPSVAGYGQHQQCYSSTFCSNSYLQVKSFRWDIPSLHLPAKPVWTRSGSLWRSNLFTFSKLTKYNIDPEQPGVNNGYYPQQKTLSFGINFSL